MFTDFVQTLQQTHNHVTNSLPLQGHRGTAAFSLEWGGLHSLHCLRASGQVYLSHGLNFWIQIMNEVLQMTPVLSLSSPEIFICLSIVCQIYFVEVIIKLFFIKNFDAFMLESIGQKKLNVAQVCQRGCLEIVTPFLVRLKFLFKLVTVSWNVCCHKSRFQTAVNFTHAAKLPWDYILLCWYFFGLHITTLKQLCPFAHFKVNINYISFFCKPKYSKI